jgi:hypothetical protein
VLFSEDIFSIVVVVALARKLKGVVIIEANNIIILNSTVMASLIPVKINLVYENTFF